MPVYLQAVLALVAEVRGHGVHAVPAAGARAAALGLAALPRLHQHSLLQSAALALGRRSWGLVAVAC